MIISKKQYEMAIAKAKAEEFERQEQDRRFMDLYKTIDKLDNHVRFLEGRLCALENPCASKQIEAVTMNNGEVAK